MDVIEASHCKGAHDGVGRGGEGETGHDTDNAAELLQHLNKAIYKETAKHAREHSINNVYPSRFNLRYISNDFKTLQYNVRMG